MNTSNQDDQAGSEPYITFLCERCESALEAPSDRSGRTSQCPTCGAEFLIPKADPHSRMLTTGQGRATRQEERVAVHAYASAGKYAPQIVATENGGSCISCPRCRSLSEMDADRCARCGLPFTIAAVEKVVAKEATTRAAWCVVLGVLALPAALCGGVGLIPAIASLCCGWSARRYCAPGRGIAGYLLVIGVLLSLGAIALVILEILHLWG